MPECFKTKLNVLCKNVKSNLEWLRAESHAAVAKSEECHLIILKLNITEYIYI